LSEDELLTLDKTKQSRVYEPGETLYHQGDDCTGVYCIQSGLVGLRHIDENGHSVLLKLHSPGTTIGYRAFLSKEEHSNSAEILSPGVVCFLERSTVTNLLSKNPKLGERFLMHCLDDLNDTENDYANSLLLDKKMRLLHTLMYFYERFGKQDEQGGRFVDLPIKRIELADLIGIRPESLSRLIRTLEVEGILQFDRRRVDFSKMEEILDQIGAGH
jgi:CRP-like cAMP-binding protein